MEQLKASAYTSYGDGWVTRTCHIYKKTVHGGRRSACPGVAGKRRGGHLDKVAQSLGGAPGAGVDVLDARHLQHLFGDASGHDTGAARRGDEADQHTAALAGDLRAIGGSALIRQPASY